MTCVVHSAVCLGLNVYPVTIESALGSGFSGLQLIGVPQEYARDARERIRAALESLGFTLPARRLVVSFRPSDVLRQFRSGLEHLDLPCALAILAALSQQQNPGNSNKQLLERISRSLQSGRHLFAGQLTLAGDLLPPEQILPFEIVSTEAQSNSTTVWSAIAPEQVTVSARKRFRYVRSLNDCIRTLIQPNDTSSTTREAQSETLDPTARNLLDESSLKQRTEEIEGVLRQLIHTPTVALALLTAAAGRHHILLAGSPGCGKTYALRMLKELLPPLTPSQQLDVALIHQRPVHEFKGRPYRQPHHSCSAAALLGGSLLQPGEVSLAHHGLLFLDELAEFPRPALEALREPLDERKITLSRARGRVELPADFLLAAATNPCACGYFFSKTQSCRCVGSAPLKYQQKLSGPLLERFSILLLMDDVLTERDDNPELVQLAQQWREVYLSDPHTWLHHFISTQCNLWNPVSLARSTQLPALLEQTLHRRCIRFARSARAQSRLVELLETTYALFGVAADSLVNENFIKAVEQFRGFENALQKGVAFLTPLTDANHLKLSLKDNDTHCNVPSFSEQ